MWLYVCLLLLPIVTSGAGGRQTAQSSPKDEGCILQDGRVARLDQRKSGSNGFKSNSRSVDVGPNHVATANPIKMKNNAANRPGNPKPKQQPKEDLYPDYPDYGAGNRPNPRIYQAKATTRRPPRLSRRSNAFILEE